MAFELREGQGTLFRNKKRENGSSHQPDYRGELNIGGALYELAGWKKEGKSGPWLSLSFKPKEPPAEKPAPTKPKPSDDEDIPFILNECHYEVAPRLERRLRRV